MRKVAQWAAVAAAMLLASAAWADRRTGWLVSWENDYLGRSSSNTDRWYTNGLHYAEGIKRPDTNPGLIEVARDVGAKVGVRKENLELPSLAAFFGQNIYTPKDITRPDQQVFDRPWAGWLYAGLGVFTDVDGAYRSSDVKLGVVGPASMAQQVQSGLHKVIHDDDPAGWRNQLRPRLGVQWSYTHTERFLNAPVMPDWSALHVHSRLTAGNVKTLAAVGFTLVAGEKDRVMGAPDEGDYIALDFNDRKNFFKAPLDKLTVFLQGQWAYVAHNQFITGRTYGEQPQITLKRQVAMMTLGFSWKHSKAWRTEYRIKRRTPEFSAPGMIPDDSFQNYGELRFVRDLDV